jgi:hypothetical protein
LRGKGGRGIEVAVDYCGSEGEEEGGCCEADAWGTAFYFCVRRGGLRRGIGDGIPVMRTTLPLMACRSASLMITSAMSPTGRNRGLGWWVRMMGVKYDHNQMEGVKRTKTNKQMKK